VIDAVEDAEPASSRRSAATREAALRIEARGLEGVGGLDRLAVERTLSEVSHARTVWKKVLAVGTMLVVLIGLPLAGAELGARVGDATCDRDGEFLDCIGETVVGAFAGLVAGLVASVLLLTLVVLRHRRKRRAAREDLQVGERELEAGGLT
jgi:hypothetical protein